MKKAKTKLTTRTKRLPDAGTKQSTKPAPETPQTALVRQETGDKKPKRPPVPQSYSFELEQVLIVEWYDEGARFAVGKVQSKRYLWSEEQERWLESIELQLLNAVGFGTAMEVSKKHVTLTGTHGRWMGPRETSYELREPNPKERETANGFLSHKSAQGASEKVALGTGTRTRVSANGQAAQIQAAIKQEGGATMQQLREIAPLSAGSVLSSLRKAGLNIQVTKNRDGSKTYEVKGA